MGSFVGPKTKKQKEDNDREYLKKFNAYNRGDKGTMTRNENKYFGGKVKEQKDKKFVGPRDTFVGPREQPAKKDNFVGPKESVLGKARRTFVGPMQGKKRSETRPDPFARNGVRTGSEDLFKDTNGLSNWMSKLGQTTQDRAGGKDTSYPKAKKKKDTSNYDRSYK